MNYIIYKYRKKNNPKYLIDATDEIQREKKLVGIESNPYYIKKKLFRHIMISLPMLKLFSVFRRFVFGKKNECHFFLVACNCDFSILPLSQLISNNVGTVYLYDVWPGSENKLAELCRIYNIRNLNFFSRQSMLNFQKSVSGHLIKSNFTLTWTPESASINFISKNAKVNKDIDVIYFGVRLPKLHRALCIASEKYSISYLYTQDNSKQNLDILDLLPRSKISVCLTSEITRPLRSKGISTVTQRYFESIASKALIVGEAPEELSHLHDPFQVVNLDLTQTEDQLARDILTIINRLNLGLYSEIVEKNFVSFISSHTWECRLKKTCKSI